MLGCAGDPISAQSAVPVESPENAPQSLLEPAEQLQRVSMALRGVRPSVADLDALDEDPALLTTLVDDYLDSEEFGRTIRDLHAQTLLIRTADGLEYAVRMPDVGPLEEFTVGEIHRSLTEAPLRMVERIVREDRPYTDILQADWTMTDPIHATVWGLEHDPDGPDWQVATWPDGRPAAGLLSSSSIWARYVNNGINYGRGRANFVARAFLCQDFFDRQLPISHPDELGSVEVVEAANSEPNCLSCHQSLDPLASFFWVFRDKHLAADMLDGWGNCDAPAFVTLGHDVAGGNCFPFLSYYPPAATVWQDIGQPAPAYFGSRGEDLADLGRMIADDGRFSLCAARRFEGFFTKQLPSAVPFERAAELQLDLLDSGWSAKQLVRGIVLAPAFLGSPVSEVAPAPLLVSPRQLASLVEDLTGFRWTYDPDGGADVPNSAIDPETWNIVWGPWGETEIATSAAYGVRAVAGGIDGYRIKTPSHGPSPALTLLQRRLGEEAAAWVVRRDFSLPAGDRQLLRGVEDGTDDPATVEAQLRDLHRRFYSLAAEEEDEDIDGLLELFALVEANQAAEQEEDELEAETTRAWTVVLSVMLQDPRILLY